MYVVAQVLTDRFTIRVTCEMANDAIHDRVEARLLILKPRQRLDQPNGRTPSPERSLGRNPLEIEPVDGWLRRLHIAGACLELYRPRIGTGIDRRARSDSRGGADIIRGGHTVDDDAQLIPPRKVRGRNTSLPVAR